MKAHHIRLRPRGSWPIADTPEARRMVVRSLLDRGVDTNLLAFGIADNHLHIEVVCSRKEAGELARRLEISLGRLLRLPDGFEPAWIAEVEDATHLRRLFEYVQRQGERHQLLNDPMREGCSLPDLLGLRPRGAYLAANVRRFLPRVKRGDLIKLLGADFDPAPTTILAEPRHIVEAGMAASLLVTPRTKNAAHADLRRAVASIATEAGHSGSAIADALGVSKRSARRLRSESALAPTTLRSAIIRQLSFRQSRLHVLAGLADDSEGVRQ